MRLVPPWSQTMHPDDPRLATARRRGVMTVLFTMANAGAPVAGRPRAEGQAHPVPWPKTPGDRHRTGPSAADAWEPAG